MDKDIISDSKLAVAITEGADLLSKEVNDFLMMEAETISAQKSLCEISDRNIACRT